MKVGLFFGSFNPIHIGHLIIASYSYSFANFDSIWFVITPKNPLSEKKDMIPHQQRYQIVYESCLDDDRFHASNFEFSLKQPNYTVDTLRNLFEKYPRYDFSIIMGEDNYQSLQKWKSYEYILEYHNIYVYPRVLKEKKYTPLKHNNIHFMEEAPLLEISSTNIRERIKKGLDIRYYMEQKAFEYLKTMGFYT